MTDSTGTIARRKRWPIVVAILAVVAVIGAAGGFFGYRWWAQQQHNQAYDACLSQAKSYLGSRR